MGEDRAVCECMRDARHDCLGRRVDGPTICNVLEPTSSRGTICRRYYRMVELKGAYPWIWSGPVCCEGFRTLFLQCAEESGHLAGTFDIRIYPNDGKDVWRNYRRVTFFFCPFCGEADPTEDNPEKSRDG